jgi:hypothetical protein
MKKYRFRVYTTYDPEDGFWAWAYGNTAEEAEMEVRSEYHSIMRVDCFGTL